MRSFIITLTVCALAFLLYTAAFAQGPLPSEASKAPPALEASKAPPPSAPLTRVGDDTTQIIVDTQAHTVRIVIEGREVGRFDATGLHVTGDLDYSGFIRDTQSSEDHAP